MHHRQHWTRQTLAVTVEPSSLAAAEALQQTRIGIFASSICRTYTNSANAIMQRNFSGRTTSDSIWSIATPVPVENGRTCWKTLVWKMNQHQSQFEDMMGIWGQALVAKAAYDPLKRTNNLNLTRTNESRLRRWKIFMNGWRNERMTYSICLQCITFSYSNSKRIPGGVFNFSKRTGTAFMIRDYEFIRHSLR